jgi:hypothetical protein
VRYISRLSAVRERDGTVCGFMAHNLPAWATEAQSYTELREKLAAYATVREEEEQKGRSHFRCVVSFERDVDTRRAREMVREWLKESFPKAIAVSLVHRNAEHVHAHVWLDARQTDGRKISLSPRDNRAIGENWNRIYAREMGRDEQEYLRKCEETRDFKRAKALGEERARPERVQERRQRGHEEGRFRGDAGGDRGGALRGDRAPPGDGSHGPEALGGEHEATAFVEASRRAVRDVTELRQDLARLGDRSDQIDRTAERERE